MPWVNRMSLILGYTAVHADVPMRDILQSDKSHRSVLGSHKCPRERSSGKLSEVQTSPSKGKSGRPGKAPKRTSSSVAIPHKLVPYIDQHPNAELPGTIAYDSQALIKNRSKANLDIQGADGKLYPSMAYQLYAKWDCQVNKNRYGCFTMYGTHPRGTCTNPDVSPSHMHAAHMPPAAKLSAAALAPV